MHHYMQIATDDHTFDTGREDEVIQSRSCCQGLLESLTFQMCIGAVILANAVVIGLETDIHGHAHLWSELEDAFLLVFLLELMLKLCVYGFCGFFASSDKSWNTFDFLIVTLGVSDRVISHISKEQKGGARFFVLLMRTFRLLRLLRIIRIFRLMKQLYLLANSLLEAGSAVCWVSVLCVMILYISAIVITRLVGQPGLGAHDAPLLDEFRVEHFGSVPTSMLTLFRLMTFPDLEKFKPVIDVMPGMTGFFVGWIIFMAFAMVSLLTGVITESLLEKGRQREDERRFDRERTRRLLAEDLRRAFQERGAGGVPGVLNRHQFEQCKEEVLRLCSHHAMRLRPKDLDALFELVDDGSGNIDPEELLYGMVQLNSEVRPMAVMELRRLVVRGIHGISEQMTSMDARMQMMDRRMIELQAAARFGALAPPASADVLTPGVAAPAVGPPPAPVTSVGPTPAPAPAPGLVDLLGGS